MSTYLKQSTTTTVQLGPFLDSTDGVTAETALSPTVEVSKAGATFVARNSATAIAHDQQGWYRVELDTTDTNTLGRFMVKSDEAGALPVWHEFTVLPANVFDSLVSGSDLLDVSTVQIAGAAVSTTTAQIGVNVVQISTDATAADNAEAFFDGTGYAGTNNVIPTVTTLTGHTAQTGDSFARLGAPAGASVSADVAAAKSDTAAILTDTDTTIPAQISALSIPTANANADALLDRASGIESSYTLRQALRLILSAAAGKLSGAATTTVTIRDAGDTKDRITATVDADGNRTAVTLDGA